MGMVGRRGVETEDFSVWRVITVVCLVGPKVPTALDQMWISPQRQTRVPYGHASGTYLADELPDHPVPGGVMELVTIPAIRGLVNLIFEAQSLG